MNHRLLEMSTLGSIVVGKIMVALGLTPALTITEETRRDLYFYGSVIQVDSDFLEAEFLQGDTPYKMGTQLEAFGYTQAVYGFLTIQDPLAQLKLFRSNNLIQILAILIFLSDEEVRKENHLIIGNITDGIGNLISAMGKDNRIRGITPLSDIDPLETKGAWVQVAAAVIVLLGEWMIQRDERSNSKKESEGHKVKDIRHTNQTLSFENRSRVGLKKRPLE
ncbi:hypothetical protein EWH99_12795 [Sporolactobacillus sp. THM7-7]|nr:hypothetical protein EWH99_12795 [Sporolactobacillus sp. THM7-7]